MSDDWGPPYSAYRLIRVRSLPVPHNPFRLPEELADDWLALCGAAGHRHQGFRARRGRDRWVRKQRDRSDLALIWDMAGVDWTLAADLARRIWARGERQWGDGTAAEEILADHRSGEVGLAAYNLCYQPIVWSRGDDGFTDGQHRSLVLAVQNVERVLVCTTRRW